MTTSQNPQPFDISAEEIQVLARSIALRLQSEIPAYGRIQGSPIEQDLIASEARNLELYLECLGQDRVPEPEELAELEAVSGRRLRQGFPLDAVLRAGRLEAQAMWEVAVARAPSDSLARLATLTMRYLDVLNSVSERGYVHAREDIGRPREEAIRLFLSRVISEDFADEAEANKEAQLLGYSLSGFRVGVDIGPGTQPAIARSAVDMHLADLVLELRRRFPDSPACLVDAGVVMAVPASAAVQIANLIASSLTAFDSPAVRLAAGLGSPRAGAQGLMMSLREARRARTLGLMLDPLGRVHDYDELRLLDLFKQDDTVDSFALEVLGPLLDRERRGSSSLVETLDAFFAAGMVRKAAAAKLSVHPNTLDYRLREIESVLGYPVRSGNSAFKLQLALKLLPLTRRPRKRKGTVLADGPLIRS